MKSISGDIVGDDSYFPRERYPNGWEIDDMVWEYGAAISALVVNDNTATVTLTPGPAAGDAVQAEVAPRTPDFIVDNRVDDQRGECESGFDADARAGRAPGGGERDFPAEKRAAKAGDGD